MIESKKKGHKAQRCENEHCKSIIRVMAFMNEGYCSDLCRKVLAGEITESERLHQIRDVRPQRIANNYGGTP